MDKPAPAPVVCQVCKRPQKLNNVVPAELITGPVAELIRKAVPDWSGTGFVCLPDLNRFRAHYVEDVLEIEKGELSSLEQEVVESLKAGADHHDEPESARGKRPPTGRA